VTTIPRTIAVPVRRPVVLVVGDGGGCVDLAALAARADCDVVESPWCEVHDDGPRLDLQVASVVDDRGHRVRMPPTAVTPDVVVVTPAALPGVEPSLTAWSSCCPGAWFVLPSGSQPPAIPDDVGAREPPSAAWLAALPGRMSVDVLASVGKPGQLIDEARAQFRALWPEVVAATSASLGEDACVPLATVRWPAGAAAAGAVWTWGTEAFEPTRLADHAAEIEVAAVEAAVVALARRVGDAVLARSGTRLRLPMPATSCIEPALRAQAHEVLAVHPLAAVLPSLDGENGVVQTEQLPEARFVYLDERLAPVDGASIRREALFARLARTTIREREPGPGREPRYVEPGVGRTCLVGALAVTDRPDLVDFSVTGVGLTPYSWDGFVNLGTPVTGRAALARAEHRRRCADRLEAAGCPVAPVLAILEIGDETVRMPDDSISPAVIIVRGFRCVLRVKQLDPVASLYHSVQHAPLLAEAILAAAGGPQSADADVDDLLIALDQFGPAHDDIRRLLTGGALIGPWESARQMRLRLVHRYAPVLIDLARRRLAALEGADIDDIEVRDYVGFFAASLGATLGRFRQQRFLHDYHHGTDGRPAPMNTLVENNVTLLAEIPDLDTAIFVDDDPALVAEAVQVTPSHLGQLRHSYDDLHHHEVAASRAIAGTLAAAAQPGSADAVQAALRQFDAAYRTVLR
jgi:hypothetical protein